MTENDGTLEDEVADATALPVMHVTAADAGLFNVDANVMLVAELWNGTLFERDVLDGMEDESLVLDV